MIHFDSIDDLPDGGARLNITMGDAEEQIFLYHGIKMLADEHNANSDKKVMVLSSETYIKLYKEPVPGEDMKTFDMDNDLYESLIQMAVADVIEKSIEHLKEDMDNDGEIREEASSGVPPS